MYTLIIQLPLIIIHVHFAADPFVYGSAHLVVVYAGPPHISRHLLHIKIYDLPNGNVPRTERIRRVIARHEFRTCGARWARVPTLPPFSFTPPSFCDVLLYCILKVSSIFLVSGRLFVSGHSEITATPQPLYAFPTQLLMFQCRAVTLGARVCQSVLAPDCSVAGGEILHSLVGPFVGLHHQSLLIATLWPLGRGNMGYGAMVRASVTCRS